MGNKDNERSLWEDFYSRSPRKRKFSDQSKISQSIKIGFKNGKIITKENRGLGSSPDVRKG